MHYRRVHLTVWQWTFLALGAFASGLSKTGLAGLGVLTVALFALALPPRESTGALLPLLLVGDVFGVTFFRKHADWSHLWGLFPWVVVGVVGGRFAMGHVNDHQMQRLLGAILLVMVAVHCWRQQQAEKLSAHLPHTWWFAALTGTIAGFTTMVANAAGPVMILYFLALGLPKMVFVGTGAWFYMLVNAFKVPFSVNLGLITRQSLLMDACLLVPLIPGALLGPAILHKLNQKAFEWLALVLTIAAAIKLLLNA